MQQRRRVRSRPARGLFGGVRRALNSDGALGARAGAALVATMSAGAIGSVGVALVLRAFGNLPYRLAGGALLGGIVGLALAAGAIADRRRQGRIPRARRWAYGGLALIGLVVFGAVLAYSARPPLVTGLLGLLLAVASVAIGVGALILSERTLLRAAAERRRAFYAQLRASRLTRRMLGAEDYRTLRREGALPVQSGLYPGRVYLVPLRTTPSGARILVLESGRPIGGLCLRPREPLPDPEEALAHILAIRSDERAWLERANFFPQDRELTPQARGLAAGRPGNYER